MIGWLRGTLIARSAEAEVLIDVGGVGYRVQVPSGTLAAMGELGSEVALHVHTHVREDAIVLYGFVEAEERRCFEALLSAHGVGPSLALSVMSALNPAALTRAVIEEDLEALCSVPGIGRKTAARLVLDLKTRLEVPDLRTTAVPGSSSGRPEPRGEVRAALAELGYGPDEIRRALDAVAAEGAVEELLRQALRELAGARSSTRREVVAVGADVTAAETVAARTVDPAVDPTEVADEVRLRPRRLDEFLGQPQLTEHLQIVLEAARRRQQPVDHLLFAGPPGLGKTSMAGIVATEMGVGLRVTSGPALVRTGDLAAILTDLQPGDVLFIDEIHRLPRAVEEVLYPAMEDFQLDIVIGKGPTARSIRLDLPRFTLVGATTRTGLLSGPLRDRFGFVGRLDLYAPEDLHGIVMRAARILGVDVESEGAAQIASRARGTPRIANRLLRRGARLRRGSGPGSGDRPAGHRRLGALRRRPPRSGQGRPGHPRHVVPPLRGTARGARDPGPVRG